MHLRRVLPGAFGAGLLLLGALVTAPAAHADPSPAPGWPVDAPNGSDPWPTCADADAQYCVESATNNGVPASASVNVLPGTVGYNPESFNWSLPAATTAGDEAAITIRVGAFNPLYTFAFADGLSVTTSTDGSNNTTIAIQGKATATNWNRDAPTDDVCHLNDCQDFNWATQNPVAFSGNTQNMSTWGNDAISTFGGMYIATNAQESAPTVGYFNTPIEPGGDNVPHWEFQVANPHFASDGTTRNRGSFTAYLPPGYFTTAGVTAASSEFEVFRDDGGTLSTVAGTTTTDVAGGAKLEIPDLGYSSPTLKVRSIPRSTPGSGVTNPPAPTASTPGAVGNIAVAGKAKKAARTITWTAPTSNGGAAITGYQVAVTRTFKAKVKKKSVTKTVQVASTTTTGTRFTLNVAKKSTYTVKIAAVNSQGSGPTTRKSFAGRR